MKRKTTRALPIIFTVLFAAVFVHFGYDQSTLAEDSELRINRTVVLSGLRDPWDLAFSPDGAMLFTEWGRVCF